MRLLIGVDVGGTFTDAVAFDLESGQLWTAKARSTPADQSEGFADALALVLAAAGAGPETVERVAHGTTVGTNAILEQKGARIGILTTEGFEDTLYIGRQKRTEMYDLFVGPETPGFLAPRRRIAGIPGRIAPDGSVVTPLDEAAVVAAVDRLVEDGVDALAVSYLFSYANHAHEARTLELIRERRPALPVSVSHRVDPRFREYERLCVTAFDAYVRPVMERYLTRLAARLREMGVRPALQVMQSRGGVTSAEVVLERTVGTVLSGLAAGVLGGQFAARRAGARDAITIDVGGTSADVALVRDGQPLVAAEGRVGRYPLRVPMVDVETVGAGGGSIAWVDASGSLRVGPRSAGADPGPACYGRGGLDATVTDASLVLGYLSPGGLAGGRLPLRLDLATQAIAERVAGPLAQAEQLADSPGGAPAGGVTRVGLPAPRGAGTGGWEEDPGGRGRALDTAAAGIHRVINGVMADALRLVSVRRGLDPRQFALVALGGAGPVHAGRLAVELSIPVVIVPAAPGVLSAFGLLVADVDHQEWASLRSRLDALDPARLAALLERLETTCTDRMARDGIAPEGVRTSRVAELRYVGQAYELQVDLPDGPVGPATVAACAERFHAAHRAVYGQSDPGGAVEMVSVRVQQRAALAAPERLRVPMADGTPPTERLAYFAEVGRVATPVWSRWALSPGQRLLGPAIVEQPDTTTVVYPGQELHVDDEGNLLIHIDS